MYTEKEIWDILSEVEDPEIPVLTVIDMGIIRSVSIEGDLTTVVISPTYSGCPAMKTIETDIAEILEEKKVGNFKIITQLSPAWTTDWMSESGKEKLRQTGIAPPVGSSSDKGLLMSKVKTVNCPRCGSADTHLISQFGTTACKALYKCNTCLDPFDYFKCL
jgi:ring-1,2-phenylacetyl-CoA epoxidase subunit PaaD